MNAPDLDRRALDALDRIDEIATCWQALSEILCPDLDLQSRQRDHLSVLAGFLSREYAQAREALAQSIRHT